MYTLPQWFQLKGTVARVRCFTMDFQEPYFILPFYENSIVFDNRFQNYGYNKVQLFEHLRAANYNFYILSQAFLMDLPHPEWGWGTGVMISSKLRKNYKYNKDELMKMMKKYRQFQKELLVYYGYQKFATLCPRVVNSYYSRVWGVCYKQRE